MGLKQGIERRYKLKLMDFQREFRVRKMRGMSGNKLVKEVLVDWEGIVNKVAKAIVGDKMIVCGRAARWWDDEVKARIEHRREVYRKIPNGQEELGEENFKLHREIKSLVTEKTLMYGMKCYRRQIRTITGIGRNFG